MQNQIPQTEKISNVEMSVDSLRHIGAYRGRTAAPANVALDL